MDTLYMASPHQILKNQKLFMDTQRAGDVFRPVFCVKKQTGIIDRPSACRIIKR